MVGCGFAAAAANAQSQAVATAARPKHRRADRRLQRGDAHLLPAERRLPVVGFMTDLASSPPKPKFKLGSIVATPGALEAMTRAGESYLPYIGRHLRGDWGDLAPGDAALNNAAIGHEGDSDRQGRLLSSYETASGKRIWIITEHDRSITTILLPSEY
jgi:hypothetical protein